MLTSTDYIYDCFRVDVLVDDGRGEIRLELSWPPLMDFVLMLVLLRRDVVSSGKGFAETTISPNWISATRRGACVELSYDSSDAVMTVSIEDFMDMPRIAMAAALDVMYSAHADLRSNEYLITVRDMIEAESLDKDW